MSKLACDLGESPPETSWIIPKLTSFPTRDVPFSFYKLTHPFHYRGWILHRSRLKYWDALSFFSKSSMHSAQKSRGKQQTPVPWSHAESSGVPESWSLPFLPGVLCHMKGTRDLYSLKDNDKKVASMGALHGVWLYNILCTLRYGSMKFFLLIYFKRSNINVVSPISHACYRC